MYTFLEVHFAVTTFLFPIINVTSLVLLVIGYIYSPFKQPLAVLILATILLLLPQCLLLLCFLKKSLSLAFPSPMVVRELFPVQAIAQYLGFVFHITGLFLLIKSLVRIPTQSATQEIGIHRNCT